MLLKPMSKPLHKVCELDDLSGQYVLLRTSMNVPIKNGQVMNQFRITRGLATIKYLTSRGARVILCGHLGKGEPSAEPVAALLKNHLPAVTFVPEVVGEAVDAARAALGDGEVLVLENVRRDPREMKNGKAFAKQLAALADLYVNDAFAASHREHASLCAVTAYLPSYVGLNFVHERDEFMHMRAPKKPALFMLGGAKFQTKMPLVEQFLNIYDQVFIGGALANDFFKAKGYEIGTSLVSDIDLTNSPLLKEDTLLLPVDVTVSDGTTSRVCAPNEVGKDEKILDLGPATVELLRPLIADAATILWNGPFGNYEAGFAATTEATAKLVAAASGYAVVGGGDTVASIEGLGVQEHFAFLSTAGGAMLTFLETGTLVALEAQYQAPNYA